MFIYEYSIRALDFIYFARKSLIGDITPAYIHSTALNAALQTVFNMRDDENYIVMNEANKPRYNELFKNKPFYLTPARPVSVTFVNQGITSNPEGYIFKVTRGEILRFQPMRVATPGSIWTGFLVSTEDINIANMKIRLGRGRSPAKISFKLLTNFNRDTVNEGTTIVSHVGDPLNYKIVKGLLINTLPYPLVENPTIRGRYIITKSKIIGIPNTTDIT